MMSMDLTNEPIIMRLHPDDIDLLAKKITIGITESRAMPEKLIDIEELHNILGISMSTLYKYTANRKQNGLPCRKVGKDLRFRASEVQEWMRKRSVS